MLNFEEWSERQLDGKFLIDSGLLYAINRDVLHPLGLALSVKDNVILIKDSRITPETLVFNKETVIAAYAKLRSFMDNFGGQQMERRREKLGWAVQPQIYGEK